MIVLNEERLKAIFRYLEETESVRDVLICGGEPLALSDEKLDWILGRLRSIPAIEFVRIGTKMPAVLPQEIQKCGGKIDSRNADSRLARRSAIR